VRTAVVWADSARSPLTIPLTTRCGSMASYSRHERGITGYGSAVLEGFSWPSFITPFEGSQHPTSDFSVSLADQKAQDENAA
jgi:hypothetical protein